MSADPLPRSSAIHGALAGAVGGVVFGAAMAHLGTLPTIAEIVRTRSPLAGFAVHMVVALLVGAGFGLLTARRHLGTGELLLWGLTYAAFWWLLGALTLLPLIVGDHIAWDLAAAQAALPSLFGHFAYGAATALSLSALRASRSPGRRPSAGALLRGASAGLLAAWLVSSLTNPDQRLAGASRMLMRHGQVLTWTSLAVMGVAAGMIYAALYQDVRNEAGPATIRGLVYGFVCWITIAVSAAPVLDGDGLAWSLGAVHVRFPTLPGYLLFGAAMAAIYGWLNGLAHALFADDMSREGDGAPAARGLRAAARGAVAGIVGGLLFTLVMLEIGYLPTVARLIGARSAGTGLAVHLLISILIGISYGLLFRRHNLDIGSALAWGVGYGLLWWVLGALTLLPLLLGGAPQWSAQAVAATLPSLVGHLAYGGALGMTFYALEVRTRPWWITRNQADSVRAKRHRHEMLSAAPATWALIALIAAAIPLLTAHP